MRLLQRGIFILPVRKSFRLMNYSTCSELSSEINVEYFFSCYVHDFFFWWKGNFLWFLKVCKNIYRKLSSIKVPLFVV